MFTLFIPYCQLYRCYIIWGSSLKVVALPILIYFGAMCTYKLALNELISIIKPSNGHSLIIYESAIPGASFFSGNAVSYGVPYFSLTISLNVILTCAICGRLLSVRNRIRKILGEQHCQTYTGVVSVQFSPFKISRVNSVCAGIA